MYIKKFLEFNFINEATINDSKKGISYKPGTAGLRKNLDPNLILEPISDEQVESLLRKTKGSIFVCSGSLIEDWSYEKLPISKINDLKSRHLFYKGNDNKYYAFAYGPVNTFVQSGGVGSAKRSLYNRELAFCIQLGLYINETYDRPPVKIYDGSKQLSKSESVFLLTKWYQDNDKFDSELFYEQCEVLCEYLDNDINRINKIVNSTPDYSLLTKVNELKTQPKDKWNPSDMWITFDDFDEDFSHFNTLSELNTFLLESFTNKENIIGISLKQPVSEESVSLEVKNYNNLGIETDYEYVDYTSSANTGITINYQCIKDGDLDTGKIVIRSKNIVPIDKRKDNKTRGIRQITAEVTGLIKQTGGGISISIGFENSNNMKKFNLFKNKLYTETIPELRSFILNIKHQGDDVVIDMLENLDGVLEMNGRLASKLQALYYLYLLSRYEDINKSIENIVINAKSLSETSSVFLVLK